MAHTGVQNKLDCPEHSMNTLQSCSFLKTYTCSREMRTGSKAFNVVLRFLPPEPEDRNRLPVSDDFILYHLPMEDYFSKTEAHNFVAEFVPPSLLSQLWFF